MEFLKSSDLSLNPANYLISSISNKPVNHTAFVEQQRKAEYIIKLSEAIKGKNFKHGKVDDLNAIKAAVRAAINDTNQVYGTAPSKPVGELTSKLADEAMAFIKFDDQKSRFDQINVFMNQFNSINDVESVGDYFEEKVTKLNKIYSISEIMSAVESNIEILG